MQHDDQYAHLGLLECQETLHSTRGKTGWSVAWLRQDLVPFLEEGTEFLPC